MPDKKSDNQPITITFTIDPAMKLNTQGQRCMAVSVVARQGDAGQVSRFDMTNWKTDLPAEVDRLMRLLLGGLALPDFPDMNPAPTAVQAAEPDHASEDVGEETAAETEQEPVEDPTDTSFSQQDVEAEDEFTNEDKYEISVYESASDAPDAQANLF